MNDFLDFFKKLIKILYGIFVSIICSSVTMFILFFVVHIRIVDRNIASIFLGGLAAIFYLLYLFLFWIKVFKDKDASKTFFQNIRLKKTFLCVAILSVIPAASAISIASIMAFASSGV